MIKKNYDGFMRISVSRQPNAFVTIRRYKLRCVT